MSKVNLSALNAKEREILLEALEDYLYKVALAMEGYKGKPMNKARRELDRKQQVVEQLIREIEKFSG